jgi:S1-C subfamily serine protease
MSRIALFLPVLLLSVTRVLAAAAPAPVPTHVPAPVPAPGVVSSPASWAQTLERIASGVVTIQIDSTRAFDTEWNTTAQATGFVIDAKRGLILTNRHVVTPGPVTAQAIFLNREEVQLYPVYRDPIHDFGIYRYDPAKLKFIQPAELPLYPAGAVIGREIRVVGTMPASSCRFLPAPWRDWIVRRPNTATASTTISIRSTTKPPPAPQVVLPARRSSTSKAGWWR